MFPQIDEPIVPAFQTRSFTVELRAEERHRGLPPTIVGHAAVFNSLSEDLGGFREQIAPGTFTRTLRSGGAVYALWNHDPNFVIASTKNGSLRLSEDKVGLRAEMDPLDTPTIRDLVVKPIQDGLISKMSFGFSVPAGGAEFTNDKNLGPIRTVRDADLFDVSPVTFPAYPNTDISARARALDVLRAAEMDPAEVESFLSSLIERWKAERESQKAQESPVAVSPAGAVLAAARERELILNMKRTN